MAKMPKIQWEKYKEEPIPDYNSTDGRWRIFRSMHRGWCLQDRHNPSHPEPISYPITLREAKWMVQDLLAQEIVEV